LDSNADLSYRIDECDRIVFVDDSWSRFAQANDAADLTPRHVLGRPIWEFVTDETTRALYRDLVGRVRRSGVAVRFPFRCDAPEWRRRLEMTIARCPGSLVEFRSRTLAAEPRPAVPLLSSQTARSSDLLRMCAWCQRVFAGAWGWVEAEEAVDRLQLFSTGRLPLLSHGLCPECYEAMRPDLGDATPATR
jgi:hypothetical protein